MAVACGAAVTLARRKWRRRTGRKLEGCRRKCRIRAGAATSVDEGLADDERLAEGGAGEAEAAQMPSELADEAQEPAAATFDPFAEEVIDTKTTIVDTEAKAQAVLEILTGPICRDLYHAIDTEVMGWHPGISPYLKGEVFCISIYCGDHVNFGEGARLFIDDLYLSPDGKPTRRGILPLFKQYLEDPNIKKVFHNYSFDRAQFVREGIHVQGFYADTMHMAYLDDSQHESFTLQYLGKHLLGDLWAKNSLTALAAEANYEASEPEKLHLNTDPSIRKAWEDYSAFDTQATWKLFEKLQKRLRRYGTSGSMNGRTLFDLYVEVHAPYAEVLASMEEAGIPVDQGARKKEAATVACDLREARNEFIEWVKEKYRKEGPDDPELITSLDAINFKSVKQIRHIINGWGIKVVADRKLYGLRLASAFFTERALTEEPPLRGLVEKLQERRRNLKGEMSLTYCSDQEAGPALFNLGRVLSAGTADCPSTALADVSTYRNRVWPNMFLTATGAVRRSKPNPLNLLKHRSLYPRMFQKVVSPEPGAALITVSYEDLPLALLAHMSKDSRLLYGFECGFDIHSMVAWELCPEVMAEVENGRVSIYPKEDDKDNSVETVFPAEYRMARKINSHFSRYTATKSWNEELEEYDRKLMYSWLKYHNPIREWWRDLVKKTFDETKRVGHPAATTMRGRLMTVADPFDWKMCDNVKARRKDQVVAAVQTGSYYDVIKEATVKLGRCSDLKRLGYRMIIQHYDDFILEGPDANAEEAMQVAMEHLRKPFLDGLRMRAPLHVRGAISRPEAAD